MADPSAPIIAALRRLLDGSLRRPGLRLMTLRALRAMPRRKTESAIRRLCVTARLNDETTLCRVLGRYKLFADNTDFGLSPHLMLEGYWEMWVTEAVLAMVRPGMRVIDVGANLGYFTLLLADIVGPTGAVDAFEPNPRIMALLARSVAVNGFAGRVALHASPLGAVAGTPVRLVVPDGDPKNAHLSGAGASPPGALCYDLRSVALDDVIGDRPVDFVKIDAEGAEQDIWRGMQRIVARGAPLTLILEFTAERHAGPDRFLAEFAACGFRIARIDPRRGVAPVTAQDVLRAPGHLDQMLALTR